MMMETMWREMKMLRIKHVFHDTFNKVFDGFVIDISDFFTTWESSDLYESFMNDIEWNYSERFIAPIIRRVKERYPGNDQSFLLTDEQCEKLGRQISLHFKEKWQGLDALWKEEFDPLYNYLDQYIESKTTVSHQESEGLDVYSGTDSTVHSKNTSVTRTDDLTETRDLSDNDVNKQKQTTYGKSETRTDNLTETRDLEDVDINKKKETTYGRVETRTDDLTETRDLSDVDNNRRKETTYGRTETKTDTEIREHVDNRDIDSFSANYLAGYNSSGGTLKTGGVFSDRNEGEESHIGSNERDQVLSGNVVNALSGTDRENFTGSVDHTGSIDNTGTQEKALSGKDTDLYSGSTEHNGTVNNTGTQTHAMSGSDTEVMSGSTTHTGTIDNSGTQTTQTSGSDTDATTFGKRVTKTTGLDGEDEVTKESTHRGNIGNIYTQDMFVKEIKRWENNFYKIILDDMIGYISLSVF